MSLVLHIITGLYDGGAEAVLYRLCTRDEVNRHHVLTLGNEGKYGPMLTAAGIPVTCLGMPPGRVTMRGLRQMWRTIRQVRPDVVQTWMYHANLLGGIVARLAGQRNICWGIRQSSLDPDRTSRSTMLVHTLSARFSRHIPRRIICCAEKARDLHAESGYDAARMLVIPNGYDLSAFQPDPVAAKSLRAELELGEAERLIGFVARFHSNKDHANLLRAMARLRAVSVTPVCLLVGYGMEQDNWELVKMIADFDLTDQIRLLGPRTDIPDVMNALDLHVMSSVSEGFPNVLAEAMACGTPCVSTDVGDAAMIVGDTGRVVPPGDPAALADAIAEMLAELSLPGWPRRQEAARRQVAENFSIDRMVANYNQAWFGPTPHHAPNSNYQ